MKTGKTGCPLLTCTPRRLPSDAVIEAAKVAIAVNPLNRPRTEALLDAVRNGSGHRPRGGGELDAVRGGADQLDSTRLGLLTTKYWGPQGVRLTVGFLDKPESGLRTKIFVNMNAWAKKANVKFAESDVDPQVRISLRDGSHGGYWSYLGTDILSIKKQEPTMNLEGFTMNTPDAEFVRVVRHETGHTLGFPHEHMRRKLVDLIDQDEAIGYFKQTQGWSPAEVIAQVLTAIEDLALLYPTVPDQDSIMCYQIPGNITKTRQPILGGSDISELDHDYAAQIYPKPGKLTRAFPEVSKFYSSLVPFIP